MTEQIEKIKQPELEPENLNEKIITPGQLVLKRFMRNKLAIVGIFILVFMAVFCYLGPFFYPHGEYELFYLDKSTGDEYSSNDISNMPSSNIVVNGKAAPSKNHWLGTNQDGQDVFVRLMIGGRVSLMIGFLCVAFELFLGIIFGGISGYYGKWVDTLIMRLVDVFFCIPDLPMILILSAILLQFGFPHNLKIYMVVIVIGILGWAGPARFIRGQILSLREQEFMVAAEAVGLKARHRIFRHLIPNVIPQIIVMATLGIGGVILYEAALSFLGLGVPLPYASWGNMVGVVNNKSILTNQPYMWIPPGLCILFTVLAFNFIGDGLRDALDPKMKR